MRKVIKVIPLLAVLLIASMHALPLCAQEPPPAAAAPVDDEKELERRVRKLLDTNELFIRAAKRFEARKKSEEAAVYLRKAEEASGKAAGHMKSRDFKSAIDDYSVSTHYAIQAIVIYKNLQSVAMREAALKEQADVKAGRDQKRKYELVQNRIEEVETFIRAVEMLLRERDEPFAREKLKAAQALYNSALTSRASGLNDLALENATKAYRIATETIREIKTARAEMIAFPRPRSTNETDAFNYELRRNDTYSYYASQIITDPDSETEKLLRKGMDKKSEAMEAGRAGDLKKGTEAFRASTGFFMEAVKRSVK